MKNRPVISTVTESNCLAIKVTMIDFETKPYHTVDINSQSVVLNRDDQANEEIQ